MENNSNVLMVGMLSIVCLVFLAMVLFFKQSQNDHEPQFIAPQPQAQIQQMPSQPKPHCPPPQCPPDFIGEARMLYIMGYEDSSSGRRPNAIYKENIHYLRGYHDGAPYCPPAFRFNINIK